MNQRGSTGLSVFAVEDTTVQLVWSRLAAGPHEIRIGDVAVTTAADGGPGVITVEGLEPDRPHAALVTGPGLPSRGVRLPFRTLPTPPGPELYRFATVSDLHIGIDHFDLRRRIVETLPPGVEPHPIRCTRAALDDLLTWGAQRLVVKGDITDQGLPEQWDAAGEVFADLPIPVQALPGNHDTKRRLGNVPPVVGATRAGLALTDHVDAVDVPGLRLVLAATTQRGHSRGRLPAGLAAQIVDLLHDAATPSVVLLHHFLQVLPFIWFWPPGIPRLQADRFLQDVAARAPATLITSGHTHRHRRRSSGPVVLTEVGSPKDYPGTWGGYVVHEGGIRQVVRRVESPSCLPWLERTRGAAYGTWGLWSPGRLGSRCFTHCWPPHPASGGSEPDLGPMAL